MRLSRSLLLGILLLQVASLVFASELEAQADSSHGTAIHSDLSTESLTKVQTRVGLGAEAVAENIPTKPEEIRALPELPGSELLGVGVNLREGLGMDGMTRPLVRTRGWSAFALESNLVYRMPDFAVARRNFRADMITKVFNSNQERLMDLAVSAGVEFELGMFSGSAEAHVAITKQNDRKTVISQASLDVGLYDIGVTRYSIEDLEPNLVADWNQLPEIWSDGPMRFQEFIRKWGANFVKSADIGGAFEMVGTTTVAKDVDNLSVAANVKISLEMAIKVKAKGSVDYKSKKVNEQFQNNFDFHARGGDPAVGALLASAQQAGGRDGKMEDACSMWLASLKKTPTIKSMKLGYIYDLFGGIAGNTTARRQLAMKQAIDVFMREVDVSSNVINLRQGKVKFSNFWQITDQCLNFQGVIGPENKLQVHLTSSARRLDLGYTVEIDMQRATILKAGKPVTSTASISAITPGSNTLYSTYIVCYDSRAGTVLYGRGRRVVLAYKDPRPEPAYYYGFSATGKTVASLTALQLFNVHELTCPVAFGKTCSDRGTCNEFRMCQCQLGFLGFACQQDCPLGVNNTVCSRNGQCLVDDSMGDSAQPYCVCKSGVLGQTCEINELPTLKFDIRPLGPDGALLSGRPITFSLRRESSDGRAAAILPLTTQFSFEEADSTEPSVVKAPIAYRTLQAGSVTVTGSITLPNNPDTVRVTRTFSVIDCSCSGKGRCDGTGTCVCRAGASGANCEDDTLTGMVSIPVSRLSSRTVTTRFTRPFGRIPKSVDLSVYEAPEVGSFNATLVGFTARELTVVVTRTDSPDGWDSELRIMYRALGARFIGEATGSVRFPAADGQVARTVAIRFREPYHETPFVAVHAASSVKVSGMQFRVLRVSRQVAVFEVSRDEGTWTTPIDAHWVARPIGITDTFQRDEFRVGPHNRGPFRFFIRFPEVFRAMPVVELKAKSASRAEIFDVRIIEINQGGVEAEVALVSGETADAGWKQNLVIRWKAYPKGFDKSALEKTQSVSLIPHHEIVGHDIGTPIQLPRVANEQDCAIACAQEPSCKGFVFRMNTPNCQGDWNSGNGNLAPALIGLGARRIHVKTALHGWWQVLRPTFSGDAWGAVDRVIMMRDGRLLGVTVSKHLVIRRSYQQDWEAIPNSCCVNSVSELQDGRLVGVATNEFIVIKESSGLTSRWIQKTGNNADSRARTQEELEAAAARRSQEAFVEVNSEVDEESIDEASKKPKAPKKPNAPKKAEQPKKTPNPDKKPASEVIKEIAKRSRRPPAPTKRPRVSAADTHHINHFFEVTQLVDGAIVAVATNQHLYTLRDSNGDWRHWTWGGSSTCCVLSVAAFPSGGVVSRGTNDQVYLKPNSLADDWQHVPHSCCVHHVSAIFPQMSRGALSEQPGRCYLKSIKPTRAVAPNSCAITGFFQKRDEDGNLIGARKAIGYAIRAIGWGANCYSWHYGSAYVDIHGKRRPLVRGLNVYLIHSDGRVEWGQADTGWNQAHMHRGGGVNVLRQLLDAAKNTETALKDGIIGIAINCHDECTQNLPGDIRQRVIDIGYRSFEAAVLHSGGLFVKDLRDGTVHADITGAWNSCSNHFRSGSFEL